mgnify:CR=1 FL=1
MELSSKDEISYQIEVVEKSDLIYIEGKNLAMGQKYEIVNYKLKLL